jgi:hypothetical protein
MGGVDAGKSYAIVPNSDPNLARQNLALCFAACVWTYCGNMCKCVCVCVRAPTYLWIWQWGEKTRDLKSPPIIRKFEDVISHLCLTGFIISIKICLKTGSWIIDGFKDLIISGEGVRYRTTSVRRQLPPSMCSCVCLIKQNVGLLLGTNVLKLSSVHQLVMHTFRRSRFCYHLFTFWLSVYLLGFLVKQWQGILETLTLFTRTKLNWFGHYQDLICPWVVSTPENFLSLRKWRIILSRPPFGEFMMYKLVLQMCVCVWVWGEHVCVCDAILNRHAF